MALAQILDLDQARRRRATKGQPSMMQSMPSNDVVSPWYFLWMPVYYWYVG